MFVSHTLLVDADSFQGQYSVLFLQPSCIELVIRYDEQEDNTDGGGEEPNSKEQNLPSLERSRMLLRSNCNAIRNYTSNDLSHAIPAEPEIHTHALFGGGIPLGGYECETGCNCCFCKSQEEADGYSTSEVLHSCEAGEDGAPDDNTDGAVFADWEPLK